MLATKASRAAFENKPGRLPASLFRFVHIACGRKLRRAVTPICRTPRCPSKLRMRQRRLKQPYFCRWIIACQHQLTIRPDQLRQNIHHISLQNPPGGVPFFRPRVRKHNIDGRQTSRRQSWQDQPHIIIPDPNIRQVARLHMPQQTGHTIYKWFRPNEINCRVGFGQTGQDARRRQSQFLMPDRPPYSSAKSGVLANCSATACFGSNRNAGS